MLKRFGDQNEMSQKRIAGPRPSRACPRISRNFPGTFPGFSQDLHPSSRKTCGSGCQDLWQGVSGEQLRKPYKHGPVRLRWGADERRFCLIPERAEIVRDIFTKVDEG
jgi:hypothetical protein